MDSISSEEIFHFLEGLTKDMAKSTKRLRYAQLKAFYNFIIDRCSLNIRNPCNASLLSKSFKAPKQFQRKILDRETLEKMIYNSKSYTLDNPPHRRPQGFFHLYLQSIDARGNILLQGDLGIIYLNDISGELLTDLDLFPG
jgi:integrase